MLGIHCWLSWDGLFSCAKMLVSVNAYFYCEVVSSCHISHDFVVFSRCFCLCDVTISWDNLLGVQRSCFKPLPGIKCLKKWHQGYEAKVKQHIHGPKFNNGYQQLIILLMVQNYRWIKLCKNNGVKTSHPSTHISRSPTFSKKGLIFTWKNSRVDTFGPSIYFTQFFSGKFAVDLPGSFLS